VAGHRERLLLGLRSFAGAYAEVTRAFAAWLGLHATDARALVEILTAEDGGAPLSPAVLGPRLGLSSGATTTVVNRLERAGCVVRSREHADRRVVTLRAHATIAPPAREFFAPLARRLDDVLAGYRDADLGRFGDLLDDLETTMAGVLADAESRPPRDPTAEG
jgi:MarR family transcriptional regulator, organic hydroperoxide resistance regulator